MLMQPVLGALSDRVGRRPILIGFGLAGTLFTVPIMTALAEVSSWWEGFILVSAALLIVSGYTSVNAVVKAELFPSHIRALGVGLPYAISVSAFGGSAEYVALQLKDWGHESTYYWYVTFCIACSLIVYVFMPDTRYNSRIDADDPAVDNMPPIPSNVTTWRARD
jgi:MHS family alpha-ketoglutarate permease-like MFS transporter